VRDDALVLETLFVADDVYSDAEIEEAVGDAKTKKQEVALALQVIDSLAGTFDPKELASEYRRDLQALLEEKLKGAPPSKTEVEEPAEAPVIDLMEALRKSVADAKKRKAEPEKAKAKAAPKQAATSTRKKVAAKKR
jgi:DNA end-binding protein Ku